MKSNHQPSPEVLKPEVRAAILAKNKNHVWGRQGFCVNCPDCHRTDFRQNDLCPTLAPECFK